MTQWVGGADMGTAAEQHSASCGCGCGVSGPVVRKAKWFGMRRHQNSYSLKTYFAFVFVEALFDPQKYSTLLSCLCNRPRFANKPQQNWYRICQNLRTRFDPNHSTFARFRARPVRFRMHYHININMIYFPLYGAVRYSKFSRVLSSRSSPSSPLCSWSRCRGSCPA